MVYLMLEKYNEAMMVAGLMSQEQVDAHNKLFKAAGSSEEVNYRHS